MAQSLQLPVCHGKPGAFFRALYSIKIIAQNSSFFLQLLTLHWLASFTGKRSIHLKRQKKNPIDLAIKGIFEGKNVWVENIRFGEDEDSETWIVPNENFSKEFLEMNFNIVLCRKEFFRVGGKNFYLYFFFGRFAYY